MKQDLDLHGEEQVKHCLSSGGGEERRGTSSRKD